MSLASIHGSSQHADDADDDAAGAADVGALVRQWRRRRRLTQQALSERCDVSTRHLSFIETGKARPSRDMIAHLSEALQVPLRERRRLFTAAGFAPDTSALPLDAPEMSQVNTAIEMILAGHDPFPALVIDGGWDLVAANEAAYRLLTDVPADLLEPPVNVIRLSLDPRGLGSRIVDLPRWRTSIMSRIRHEHDASGDPRLGALLRDYPTPDITPQPDLVLTVQLRRGDEVLSFLTTTTVFGTPGDVTVAELAIEGLYPADAATRAQLEAAATSASASR